MGVAAAGAAVAAGAKKAVDAYADFERSTVELHKKTGLSTEQVRELVNVLTDLSTELPTTRKEMVDLATEAAKLGIEGTENIVAVVKAALKLREATGIEAVEGLTAMGKILTALQLPWDQVENLGSAIVKLADVSAADAPEIVQELQKVAAAGHAVGLTGPEIATLITQIISAGNVAGRTGLRLSRILELTASNLDKVAEMMDIPMEEARKAVNENVLAFFLKFAEYVRSLPGRAEKLEALTGAYGAMGRYLLPLVQDQEGFNRLLEAANQAYSEGSELTRQYQLSLETLSTQQKIISGNFDTMTEQIGQGLAPAIKKFNEEVLGPFSQRLVEITRQWAEAQEEAGGFTLPVTFKVAKVRLEGIADAIQAALLEQDYRPALKELSIAVGAVTLGIQAWKLASESIVALKAAMKTKLGGMVFGIGTAVLSAQFVWENLPENIKKAVDRITDEWEKAVEGLPLPAGWKKTIQGWLDQIGESKWTTVITLGVTWALAQGAWKALMATLFGLFQKQGLSAEAAAGGIAVKGLKVGLSAIVKPVWNVVSGAGQALIGALKNALAAAGFSLGGGLAVAGAMFAVGATIGLGITAILKLAKMSDEEFVQSIQSETQKAIAEANEAAREAIKEARQQTELPPSPSLETLYHGSWKVYSKSVEKMARELVDLGAEIFPRYFEWIEQGEWKLEGTLKDVIVDTLDWAEKRELSWREYSDLLADIESQLKSIPEEEYIKIGVDKNAYQETLRTIDRIQSYIKALSGKIDLDVEVTGPPLYEIRNVFRLIPPEEKQTGGLVPGTGRGDKVLALLEPGEFVVPRWMMRIPEIRDLLLSVWARGYQKGGPVQLAPGFGGGVQAAANAFMSELEEVSPYDIDKLIAVIEKALEEPLKVSLKEWGTILGKYGAAVGAIEPVIQMFKRLGIETSGLEEKLARLKSLFGETAEPSLETFSEALGVSKERAHVVAEAARDQIRAYEEQIEDMELFGLSTADVRFELEVFKNALTGMPESLAKFKAALDLYTEDIVNLVRTVFGPEAGEIASKVANLAQAWFALDMTKMAEAGELFAQGSLAAGTAAFTAAGGLNFLAAAVKLGKAVCDAVDKGRQEIKRAAEEVANQFWDLAQTGIGRLRDKIEGAVSSLEDLIKRTEAYSGVQEKLSDLQRGTFDLLLRPLELVSALLNEMMKALGLVEEESRHVAETAKETWEALNVPAGFKGARYEWAAARPGEPYRPIEEASEEAGETLTWAEKIVKKFGKELGEAMKGLKEFGDAVRRAWDKIGPAIVEGLLPVVEEIGSWFAQLGDRIGSDLLPVLTETLPITFAGFLEFFGGKLIAAATLISDLFAGISPSLAGFAQALSSLAEPMIQLAGQIADGLSPVLDTFLDALTEVVDWIRDVLMPDLGSFFERFGAWWREDVDPFLKEEVFPTLVEWGKQLYAWIRDELLPFLKNTVWPFIKDRLWPKLKEVGEKLLSLLERFFDILDEHWPAIEKLINKLIDKWVQGLEDQIKVLDLALDWYELTGHWPSIVIPFQHGGIVTRPTLAWLGEAGPEAVIPLTGFNYPRLGLAAAGASISIEVEGRLVGDGRELVGVIERVRARDEIVRGKR